jgi:hypothetical protein
MRFPAERRCAQGLELVSRFFVIECPGDPHHEYHAHARN